MNIDRRDERFKQRLDEFQKALMKTDFCYMYADDPRAHRVGKESVDRALQMRVELEKEFPEYVTVIKGIYSQYSE
ncbi:MAG TPA: hypothetical protein PLI62_14220 [Spirochaetota bacterium]|nr:hypothetical protein [Spirochaetota bacterium]HQO03417.1 hypothetical protein [Spirochaetota bacterium]